MVPGSNKLSQETTNCHRNSVADPDGSGPFSQIRIRSNFPDPDPVLDPDPTIKSHITRSKSNKLNRYFCETFTRTSSSSRRTKEEEDMRTRRRTNNEEEKLTVKDPDPQPDPDPVKSRPDPQHCTGNNKRSQKQQTVTKTTNCHRKQQNKLLPETRNGHRKQYRVVIRKK